MSKIIKMKFGFYEATPDDATGSWVVTNNSLSVGFFSNLFGSMNPEESFMDYIQMAEEKFIRANGFGTLPTKRVSVSCPIVYSSDEEVIINIPQTREVYDCKLEVTREGDTNE